MEQTSVITTGLNDECNSVALHSSFADALGRLYRESEQTVRVLPISVRPCDYLKGKSEVGRHDAELSLPELMGAEEPYGKQRLSVRDTQIRRDSVQVSLQS